MTKKKTAKNTKEASKDTKTATTETPNTGSTVPPLTINAQYIKDLSFENPTPVTSLQPSETQPEINVNVDVGAENINENTFEVTLTIKAEAKRGTDVMFVSDVQYSGIFTLGPDIQKEHVHPILMIECPRLLFPFARSILANTTREGGFPPLSLNPIDFAALYQQQMEAAKKQKEA